MDISYYIQGLLRQPNRVKAREYLGLGGGGDVTESDLDFSDVTTANSTAAQHGLLPKLSGNVGDVLRGDGTFGAGGGGSGDVVGPASSVDDRIATFDGATGKLIQDSGSGIAIVPTANQKAALAGTDGAPAAGNPYVTDSDSRNTDARTPLTHAPSHDAGSSDPLDVTTLAGYPGGGTTFLRDDSTFAAPPAGASYWNVEITKSADQVVTNSTVLVDDLELFTPLDANSFYQIELDLLHSGNNTTGDYAGAFTIPTIAAGTSMGFFNGFAGSAVATIVALTNGTAQWPSTAQSMAGTAANVPLTSMMRFNLKTEAASGNLQWKFANFSANVGITSTTRAGSTLRVKKLFP